MQEVNRSGGHLIGFFLFFFKYFYCISSDFSDLPDMTSEYIVLSVVYSTSKKFS